MGKGALRLNLESVGDLLLGSEIYCPFAVAQILWVLHIEVENII